MNWDWIFDIETDDWMLMDLEYGRNRGEERLPITKDPILRHRNRS